MLGRTGCIATLFRPDGRCDPVVVALPGLLCKSLQSQDFHVDVKVLCLVRQICRGEYRSFT